MVQKLNKSNVPEAKSPSREKPKGTDPPWYDKCVKVEYRGKTYVFAFADVTPRLKGAQFATFVTLVKGLGRILTPVVVCEIDGVVIVIDGINRLRAAIELGLDVPFDVREGLSREEMRSLAVALNYHRRHLDQAEKEARIKVELKNDPGRSDNTIADDLGVSHATVSKYRRELQKSGQIGQTDKRRDRKGHLRPGTQPARNNTKVEKPDTGSSATGSTTDEKPTAPVQDETAETASSSQPTTQEVSQPAPRDQKNTAEQTKPAAKPSLKTAVLDADGCIVAVRSAVTRIVTLLGTESVRKAERASISKLADDLDQLARKLRDALTPPEMGKGSPG